MTKYSMLNEIETLSEMAVSRKNWIAEIKSDLLGAFGEFMCGKIADKLNLENAWNNEVKGLVKVVNGYFSKNTTFNDMRKAFKEAVVNSNPAFKINYAKRHVSYYYPHLHVQIFRLEFDPTTEFDEFIKEHIKIPSNKDNK